MAALREVFGRMLVVDWADVEERDMRILTLEFGKTLANTVHPRAATWITKELVTVPPPYVIPREWAARLSEAGFEGLLHELRHDVRAYAAGISLFGPVGPRASWPPAENWAEGPAHDISEATLSAAAITPLNPPRASALVLFP